MVRRMTGAMKKMVGMKKKKDEMNGQVQQLKHWNCYDFLLFTTTQYII